MDPRQISRTSEENQMPMPFITPPSRDLYFGSWPTVFLFMSFIFVRRHNFSCLGFSISQSILKSSGVFHVSLTRFNHLKLFPVTLSNRCLRYFRAWIYISITECREWQFASLSVRTSTDWTLIEHKCNMVNSWRIRLQKAAAEYGSLGLKFSCGLLDWLL